MRKAIFQVLRVVAYLWLFMATANTFGVVVSIARLDWSNPQVVDGFWAIVTPLDIVLQIASIATAFTLANLLLRWSRRRIAAAP